MAMQRVEQRLIRVTAALDRAGIAYAVVGGNAVAAWVATVDPAVTRTTKDVDLLVRRRDIDQVTEVMSSLGFLREDLRSPVLFVDPEEPSRETGVHVVWASECVRPSYVHAAPDVEEANRQIAGFAVLDLGPLIRMKLTSFRDVDRVHIADLYRVGLVSPELCESLPADLRDRIDVIKASVDSESE